MSELQRFEFEGLSIRYRQAGDEAGAPLIFLHNGGTSHVIWDEVIELLEARMETRSEARFQIFALDLLGFGESAKPKSGYALARYVAMLSAFIEAHALAPVYLVGNCMGSATSLSYAIAAPHKVRAMALINTLTQATFETGIYGRFLPLPGRAPRLTRALSKLPLGKAMGRLSVRSQLGKRGIARRVDTESALTGAYAHASQSRSLLKVLAEIPQYAALDAFQAPPDFPPICTIWGLENRVLPAREGRAFVKKLQPARQEWLAGCGHLAMLEHPERVAAILDAFFTAAPQCPTETR